MIDYTNIRKALESYFDDKDSGYLIKFDNEDCVIDIYKHVYKGESYDIYGTSISMVPKIIDGNIDTVKTFTNSLISSYNKDNILDIIEQESFVSIINGDDCIRGTLRYNHKMKQLNILSVDNDKIYEGVRFEHESLDDAYKDLEVMISGDLELSNIIHGSISCGYNHCTALKNDGSLVSWGDNDDNVVSNTPSGNDLEVMI